MHRERAEQFGKKRSKQWRRHCRKWAIAEGMPCGVPARAQLPETRGEKMRKGRGQTGAEESNVKHMVHLTPNGFELNLSAVPPDPTGDVIVS